MPEGSRITAPAAVAYKGYVYLTGNDTGLFRSRDPLGPFDFYGDLVDERGRRLESDICDGCGDGGVFDPMLFVMKTSGYTSIMQEDLMTGYTELNLTVKT